MTVASRIRSPAEAAHQGGPVETNDAGGWYLVQLKPGGLARASLNLGRLGYEVFMPRRSVTRRQGSRLITELRALFPGYLFIQVRADDTRWRVINSTYGVAHLVSLEPGRPSKVPCQIMNELRAACGSDTSLFTPTAPSVGDAVRVISGPFAGALARIEAVPEGDRVYLLLDMMRREVRAAVSPGDLEMLESFNGPKRDKLVG